MRVFIKRNICLINVFLLLFLVGCTTIVETASDELTASTWYAKLENNNEIKLRFKDDNACIEVVFSDDEKLCVSGFCEVSDTEFIIYDKTTQTAYVFEYIVHFDRVIVKYFTNTVSLYKI